MAEWKEDMKHLIRRTGIEMEKTVFLCNMAVLQKHIFFDYIARLICGYEIPELFSSEERVEMVELYQKQTKDNAVREHYLNYLLFTLSTMLKRF